MDERKKVMKMLFFGYATLFILLLTVIFLISFKKDGMKGVHAQREVSVQGTATITASPDVANVSFDLTAKEKTPQDAKKANDELSIKLNDILNKYNIKEAGLKMNYINIRPQYEYHNSRSEVIGYVAQKTITIKIKDIEKYDSFINDILAIGISNVNSVEFTVEDLVAVRNKARTKALEAAREKAELYAGTFGKKIVDVIDISENDTSVRYNNLANYRGLAKSSVLSDGEQLKEERGSISVDATLFAVFVME